MSHFYSAGSVSGEDGPGGGADAFVEVRLNDEMLEPRVAPRAAAATTLVCAVDPGVARHGNNTLLITLHRDAQPWSYFLTRLSVLPPKALHAAPSAHETGAIVQRVLDDGYEFDSRRWRAGATGFRPGYRLSGDEVAFSHAGRDDTPHEGEWGALMKAAPPAKPEPDPKAARSGALVPRGSRGSVGERASRGSVGERASRGSVG